MTGIINSTNRSIVASYLLAAGGCFFMLKLNLVLAVYCGMTVYLSVVFLSDKLVGRMHGNARLLAVVIVSCFVVSILSTIAAGAWYLLVGGGGLASLIKSIAAIVQDARTILPATVIAALPDSSDEVHRELVSYLRGNASMLTNAGKETAHALAQCILTMAAGAAVALYRFRATKESTPFVLDLRARIALFAGTFSKVVVTQVKISAINTALTTFYLIIILPAAGISLPYVKILILITFLAGLVPVLGNLISNTAIVIVSLGSSFMVALASLGYLIAIHKLEYLINARIIGSKVNAAIWELLLAMVVMEAAFGLGGLISAPLVYAYAKGELMLRKLV